MACMFRRYTPLQQLKFGDAAYQPAQPDPAGYGVALSAEHPHSKNAFDQYYPREGMFRSVTVTLQDCQIDDQQLLIELKGHYLHAPQQIEVAARSISPQL